MSVMYQYSCLYHLKNFWETLNVSLLHKTPLPYAQSLLDECLTKGTISKHYNVLISWMQLYMKKANLVQTYFTCFLLERTLFPSRCQRYKVFGFLLPKKWSPWIIDLCSTICFINRVLFNYVYYFKLCYHGRSKCKTIWNLEQHSQSFLTLIFYTRPCQNLHFILMRVFDLNQGNTDVF